MEPNSDPFASLSPKNSSRDERSKPTQSKPQAPVASEPPVARPQTMTMTADDVGVVVDRVAKASLAPLIERVRLSTESKLGALAKKVEEMERRQREIGEDVAALRQLLQAKAGGGGAPAPGRGPEWRDAQVRARAGSHRGPRLPAPRSARSRIPASMLTLP